MTLSTILLEALKGAITGSIVGWLTNWLAVWMLFHPRKPWRIFGLPVPLTPGLVVKNHARLAEAIGRSVSRDLLAPETILAHLEKTNLAGTIEELLNAERSALLATEAPLAKNLGPAHADSLVRLEAKSSAIIASSLAETANRLLAEPDKSQPFLENFILPFLRKPLGEYVSDQQLNALCDALLPRLDSLLADRKSDDFLRSSIESLLQHFPGSAAHEKSTAFLHDVVQQKRIPAAIALQDLLARYIGSDAFATAGQDVMARRVHGMIVSRFSFAAMLVTEKKVREILAENWPQFAEELQAVIRGENLTAHFADGIADYANGMIDSLPDALRGEKANALSAMLSREILDGLRHYLAGTEGREKLCRKIQAIREKSLSDFLRFADKEPAAFSHQLLTIIIDRCVIRDEGQTKLKAQLAAAIHYFLHKVPASRLVRIIPDAEWEHLARMIAQAIERRTLRILPAVLSNHLNLADIVKAKILEFETNRLEQIIYDVSGRELKGIVWFGAVLGVIVGAIGGVVGLFVR